MSITVNGTNGLTFNDGSAQNTAATGFGFKNRIINGAMMIDQRNAGASVFNAFVVDRFYGAKASATVAYARSTVAPTGFTNSLGLTVTTGASTASGDISCIQQGIEGFNVADLGWGTANAQTVTLSFWVRSSVTGNYGASFRNGSGNRSYVASYTVNAANTWEYKTLTIAGDTSGTWTTDNTAGIYLNFDMGVGSTYSTTAGSWQAGNFFGLTGGTKIQATTGATFYITGVQLEKGSTATSFDYRPYGTELALCQRYFWNQTGGDGGANYASVGSGLYNGTTIARVHVKFPMMMRAAPTMALGGTLTAQGGGASFSTTSINGANTGTNSSMVDFAVTGATSGQGAVVYVTAVSTSYLQASAEL